MTNTRLQAIGIKQVVRLEWMQKTVDLLLSGLNKDEIRSELHEYLAERRGTGANERRGETSRDFVVNMLMKSWINPDEDLLDFRDFALSIVQARPEVASAIHWAVVSASYPFWFNVARFVGRLLTLQDQVTQEQILKRVKEQYGDRQTAVRNAKFVIRSLVAWEALLDSPTKGCYGRGKPVSLKDQKTTTLLVEAVLLASGTKRASFGAAVADPGLFPFKLTSLQVDQVLRQSQRLQIERVGIDEEFLTFNR